MKRHLTRVVRLFFTGIILVMLVVFATKVNWHSTWAAIQDSSISILLLAAAVNLFSLGLKGVRWWIFLRPIGASSILVFGLGIRREMSKRVTSEYVQRVNTLVGVINADIGREDDRSRARLAALKSALISDNNFRNVLVRGADRTYVLDYAGDAMRLAGLDFLQIQDGEGRVLSSAADSDVRVGRRGFSTRGDAAHRDR